MADPTQQDVQRALFVQQAYRYATEIDTDVKADNDGAVQDVSVDTQLDGPTALALAKAYMADLKNPVVYEVAMEGTMDLDAFIGGPPSYIPDFPKLFTSGRTMKVMSASTDYDTNTTTVQVIG